MMGAEWLRESIGLLKDLATREFEEMTSPTTEGRIKRAALRGAMESYDTVLALVDLCGPDRGPDDDVVIREAQCGAGSPHPAHQSCPGRRTHVNTMIGKGRNG